MTLQQPLPAFDAFSARTDLKSKYQSNALLLFALQLRYGIEDIDIVAATALTDGSDDKKCDLVYVDRESGQAIVAQGYISLDETKAEAKANKASDLNTAVSWLLTRPVDELPEILQSAAKDLRGAIKNKDVDTFELWYVHNLPESDNVREELKSAANTATAALHANFPDTQVNVVSREIGRNTIEQWYKNLTIPILVGDDFKLKVPGGFSVQEADWKAFMTSVPADWLYNMFQQYKNDLFSANVREYLGSRNARNNINNGIKESASNDPQHFWVFNNGVTALVHDFTYNESSNELSIHGLSIVNGAQTTGALGSLSQTPDNTAQVAVRFVKCDNTETIKNIIKFNNSQNRVLPADFRSHDSVQKKLAKEFEDIPQASYTGGRRGGFEDVIKRNPNQLSADTVAQSLAAFHLDPVIAYNRKSRIWEDSSLYEKFFSDRTTAKHIVFTYSLLKAIERKKQQLVAAANQGPLTGFDQDNLTFLRKRGAIFLLASTVAFCIETFIDKPLSDRFSISFGNEVSPDDAIQHWAPIIEVIIAFASQLEPAIEQGLNNNDSVKHQATNVRSLLHATKHSNQDIYKTFAAATRVN